MHGDDQKLYQLLQAAEALYRRLENITTEEFSLGGEAKERYALLAALQGYGRLTDRVEP